MKHFVTAIVCIAIGALLAACWSSTNDARQRWDQWCAEQGGQVVSWRQVPPAEQGLVVRDRYCTVNGKAVGSR